MDDMEPLLRVDEAAKAMSLSRSFMYQLIKERAFPVVKIGSSMRIRPEDLRAYVDRLIEEQSGDVSQGHHADGEDHHGHVGGSGA